MQRAINLAEDPSRDRILDKQFCYPTRCYDHVQFPSPHIYRNCNPQGDDPD
jgi:hypothetical protein